MQTKTLRLPSRHENPASVAPFALSLKSKIASFAKKAVDLLRKEVWLLERPQLSATKSNRILYVGKTREMNYVGNLFLGADFTARSLGRHWLWQIMRTGSGINEGCQFSILQTRWPVHRAFRFKSIFCVPCWIYGSIELNDSLDRHFRKRKCCRHNFKLIDKSRFQVEITRELTAFDQFYHQMFLPYIRKRHGECSVIDKYHQLRERFETDGELLFVKQGGRRIAGMMSSYQNGEATACRIGVIDGDFRWVEKGAISALYYHLIRHCRSRGYDKLKLGGSRPFFSDGVLNYKINNWNMKIDGYARQFYFLIKPLCSSEFVNNFLSQNPFIALEKDKMVAATFSSETTPHTVFETLKGKYSRKGISNVSVHRLSGFQGP